jgi:predicted RNA methylase
MRPIVTLLKRSSRLRAAGRKGERYLLNCIETLYDRRYNIHTVTEDISPAFHDDEGYLPISYPGLDDIRRRIEFRAGEVIVDIGCGQGRALCVFSREPAVSQCIGVEYNFGHAEIARRNARSVRARVAPIDIIYGDAAEQDYDSATLILLFNPFGEATMRRTIKCIETSLQRSPRSVRILYVNPKYEHVLQEQPWLTRTSQFHIPNSIHRSLPSSLWQCQDAAALPARRHFQAAATTTA